jgi:hypothetical protein
LSFLRQPHIRRMYTYACSSCPTYASRAILWSQVGTAVLVPHMPADCCVEFELHTSSMMKSESLNSVAVASFRNVDCSETCRNGAKTYPVIHHEGMMIPMAIYMSISSVISSRHDPTQTSPIRPNKMLRRLFQSLLLAWMQGLAAHTCATMSCSACST